MQEPQTQTWRTLLKAILKEPGERQRLANALGVNPFTLTRWANGQSDPRRVYLSRLLAIVAKQYPLLSASLTQYFPELPLPTEETDEDSPSISSAFYAEVLQKLTILPIGGIHRSIRKHILQHVLEQLDEQQNITTITIIRCVPPSSGHKVRSVQVIMGVGRSPWGGNLDQQAFFYGADSVAGRVVTSARPRTMQNFSENSLLSASNKEGIGSLSVHPILQRNRIAGTLSVISAQPEFFLPSRLSLLQQYCDLLAITFYPEDFYALEDIELRLMPLVPLQIPYLMSFRDRVLECLRQAISDKQALTLPQAELLAWQQIEEELIQMAPWRKEGEMIQQVFPGVAQAQQV